MRIKALKIIALVAVFSATASLTSNNSVYAGCESNYGGGETCIYNKSFEVEKKVRIEDEGSYKDKVVDVREGDVVEFRIRVKNVGEVTVDDMKMEDFLPNEMDRVGGSGLTEYWNDFEPGDTKEFVVKAEVDPDEYYNGTFEKCIVNKVEIEYDGAFEGSDTATVCYNNQVSEVVELPETGATANIAMSLLGTGLIALGTLTKKRRLA